MPTHGSDPGGWRVVSSPSWADLYAAVSTVDGPYAVGEGGQLLGTKNDQWSLLDEGPAFGNKGIAGVATTDDGKRIWVAGAGGALTCYDVANRDARDHTLPEGTGRATAFTIAGDAGSERGLVATADGRVVPFIVDGTSLRWRDPHKPAGGTPIEALAAPPDGHGIAIDSHGHAHRTVSGGWEPYGTVDTDRSVRALYAFEHGAYALFDGRAYRHSEESGWKQLDIGGKPAFRAVATRERDQQQHVLLVALGGTCYERVGDGPWHPGSLPGEDLVGATLGETDVAVGANGLIVERPAPAPGEMPKSAPSSDATKKGGTSSGDGGSSGQSESTSGETPAADQGQSGDTSNQNAEGSDAPAQTNQPTDKQAGTAPEKSSQSGQTGGSQQSTSGRAESQQSASKQSGTGQEPSKQASQQSPNQTEPGQQQSPSQSWDGQNTSSDHSSSENEATGEEASSGQQAAGQTSGDQPSSDKSGGGEQATNQSGGGDQTAGQSGGGEQASDDSADGGRPAPDEQDGTQQSGDGTNQDDAQSGY